MHLLLVTTEDAFDRKSWSGIPFSLREALERHGERLTVFRPGRPSRHPLDVAKRLWHGGDFSLALTPASLSKNAREVKAEIARVRPHAVLSISSPCVAELRDAGVPVFLFSDAPYVAWHEAYAGTISRPVQYAWAAEQEAQVARRLDGLCFGSEWAVAEGVRIYGDTEESRERVRARSHVTPLGANWVPGVSREEVLRRVDTRADDEIELLFVGRDWERKGGPLAVQVAGLLRGLGHAVRLHVVGCRPELPAGTEEYVTVHGLLSQGEPEQAEKLSELFLRSHFLIVPTLAECFGIAFAEAQAFALPPIARDVHALGTVIEDGVTGLLLGAEAPAAAYVERILAARESGYREMAVRARDRFETTLNWDATAKGILGAIAGSLEG